MTTPRPRRALAGFVPLAALLGPRLAAQCSLTFVPGDPVGCPAGSVAAAQVWDPDGTGPAPELLVVGGLLAVADSSNVAVAAYDGAEWRSLGAPTAGTCTALGVFGGRLIAAITRSSISSDILAFDGTTWQTIGVLRGVAHALATFSGRLVAGGAFSHVDNLPAANVAQWDGTAWSALGVAAGGVSGTVYALAVFTEGLYVGGDITQASGIPVANLALWNGTAWAATAFCNGTVRAMAVYSSISVNGAFLFVGGDFTTAGTIAAQGVARFNSRSGWSAMGAGIAGGCTALSVRATSSFTFELRAGARMGATPVLNWDGSTWNPVGTGSFPGPLAITRFRGSAVAVTPRSAITVLALDASGSWLPLSGTGIDGPIGAMLATATDVVIGGGFVFISGTRVNGIARGGPGAWQPLGTGLGGAALAIAEMPGGDIVIGGLLTSAGGVPVQNIARWDGSAWSPLGSGISGGFVRALAVLPDGQLVAAGNFTHAGGQSASGIARWNGSNWSSLGLGLFDGAAFALTVAGNGELIVGGQFQVVSGTAAANLARWNGTAWLAFPDQPNGAVTALATLASGDVLVGGRFSAIGTLPANHFAGWATGSSFWVSVPGYAFVPAGEVSAIVPLRHAEALVTTNALGPSPHLARFDGSTLMPTGLADVAFTDAVRAPDGAVLCGGGPTVVGSVATGFVARLVSTCPASAPAYGSGCGGSGGTNVLRWTALPWVGGVFRGAAEGMPSTGLALGITGLAATSIPIASLLRQGLPGCNLLATPDLIEVVTPRLGQAHTALALPVLPALVGQVLHHQVVALELDGGANVVAATASNGLRLTIGAF